MRITPLQKKFIDLYLQLDDHQEVGRQLGITRSEALRLIKCKNVQSAILQHRLEQPISGPSDLAVPEGRLAWLRSIVADEKQSMRDRLRAFELLSKACGDYIERREVRQAIVVKWAD